MRESDKENDLPCHCQMYGVLAKRPFGHTGNKWNKRFFIIKDGFLLYYPESERKEFEKRKSFNIHPKGSIPLGGCIVSPTTEPNHPFGLHIKGDDINANIGLAADNEYEREKWLNLLKESARIFMLAEARETSCLQSSTWRNAQLGDAMIDQLELQGLQIAKERQDYFDKLQNEASALHDERQRTEELERLNEELQKERSKMEQFALELKEEYEKIKGELSDTLDAVKSVEDDKERLRRETDNLQHILEELEGQKKETLQLLTKQETATAKISQEKEHLSEATRHLHENLKSIEDKTQRLLDEKAHAQTMLQEAEVRAQQLEEDKLAMSDHAQELQASIKDLAEQKAITEAELKEEVMARMDAERRLREAETSLSRLEGAVHHQGDPGRDAAEVKEEMIADVRTLKKFFENLAFEAKLDADKSVLIKNSIHARKKMVRRAKTMKFETARKHRTKDPDSPLAPNSLMESSTTYAHQPTLRLSGSHDDLRVIPEEEEIVQEQEVDLSWLRHSCIGLQKLPLRDSVF